MMKSLLCILAVTGGLTACSSDKEAPATSANTITSNDFESLVGWGVDASSLTTERAHSGKYALKVDKDREYSLTYDVILGQASIRKLKRIRLEGWVFLPSSQAGGSLSLQITDPAQDNKGIFVDGINLQESVKEYDKWVKVSKEFTLPDDIIYTQHMKVFLWRANSAEPVFADDIVITNLE